MEKLRKQLSGIGLILAGCACSVLQIAYEHVWIPIIETVLFGIFGIIFTIIGLIIVFKNVKD